jgi:hypothetical protein
MVVRWRYDAGSSQNTIDNLLNDFGIALVLAAKKVDKKGQVDRNNDLLEQRRMLVMLGSALEQDYQRARWNPAALARSQYEWASSWHPDPSEAGRYALQDYFDAYERKDSKTPEQALAELLGHVDTAPTGGYGVLDDAYSGLDRS